MFFLSSNATVDRQNLASLLIIEPKNLILGYLPSLLRITGMGILQFKIRFTTDESPHPACASSQPCNLIAVHLRSNDI